MACVCYLTGLDSLYLPSNGDEMVYSRIARLTAESGQWLPLVSDLDHMRNTKPPLLFWQAIVAGDWGQHWDLWRLRLPAALYSLALAGLLVATTWQITQRRDLSLISACVYLAFFSSYRYGRPYLTSAAETVWLTLPLWWVIWRRTSVPAWHAFAGFGLLWGLGLLYKSFALVLPTAAGLWCALLALHVSGSTRDCTALALGLTLKVAFSSLIALAVFGLWFALDPDPGAVWQEFVVGENGGKLATTALPLSAKLIAVTVQALAWVENAGPLAGVMLGLMALGLSPFMQLRHGRRSKLPIDRVSLALAAWALVWLVVFCLPSQRSARYVIPAMPALAILMTLHWQRIPRAWFLGSILLCLPVMLLLLRIGQAMHNLGVASLTEWITSASVASLGAAAALLGLVRARWTRAATIAAGLSLYALVNAALAPLSGPAGQFNLANQRFAPGTSVAVPSSFNAQYERYQFLLPSADKLRITPYAATTNAAELTTLLTHHAAVVWQSQGEAKAPACLLTQPATCHLLAERWDIKSRHQAGEIRLDNLLDPAQWLLRREWVLAKSGQGS